MSSSATHSTEDTAPRSSVGSPRLRARAAKRAAAGCVLVATGLLLAAAPALAAKGVVAGIGSASSGATGGLFNSPHGLAVNTSGNGGVPAGTLYVADTANNRIESFGPSGAFLRAFGAGVVGGGASGTGTVTGGSATVDPIATTSGSFRVGQTVTGEGIPAATTIAAIGHNEANQPTIVLSQPATEGRFDDLLTVSPGAGNVPLDERQTMTLGANTTGGTFPLTFTAPITDAVANPQTTANIAWNAPATGSGSVQAALEALTNIGAGNVEVSGPAGGPWSVEFNGRFADVNLAQMTTSTLRLTVGSGAKSAVVATAVEGAGAFEACTEAISCTAGIASSVPGGLSGPQGIAVEQSTGNLYVTDQGNDRIDVYSATGAFEGAFGWKVDATSPEETLQLCTPATGCRAGISGAGAGQLGAALGYPAISPLNGHLLVPDEADRRVDEFEPTITAGEITAVSFLRGYGWGAETGAAEFQICTTTCHAPAAGGGGAGQFGTGGPSQLGVDSSGNVYALDPGNDRVQVFSSAGNPTESAFAAAQLGTAPAPADLYVDPAAAGHVFLDKSNGTEVLTLELSTAGALLETGAAGAGLASTSGLAYDPTTANVYLATGNRVLVLNSPPVPPTATIEPVSAFTAHTAQLTGTIDPDGFEAGYHFEYSADGGLTWTRLPAGDVSVGAGSSPVPVNQEATGLTADHTYQVRLVAIKPFAAGTATAGPTTFTTAVAPSVDATYAISVTDEEARLGGEIDPNGIATTYQLEYVDAAHYKPAESNPYAEGKVVPASPEAIGAGSADAAVSQRIEGLRPATTYHYRVVATNEIGTTAGPDQTITTDPAPGGGTQTGCPNQSSRTGLSTGLPDCRAYEMVSPVEKNGGNIDRLGQGPFGAGSVEQVAAAGDSATYTSLSAFDEPQGSLIGSQYLATHAPGGGWSTQNITEPATSGSKGPIGTGSIYKAFAEDLSVGLLYGAYRKSEPPPLPLPGSGAPPGYETYYLRDSAGGAVRSLLTATPPGPAQEFEMIFRAASADLGHIVVYSSAQGAGTPAGLYEYSGGEYQPIDVLPGQTLPSSGKLAATITATHSISEDGSRVYWYEGEGSKRDLYLRQGIGGLDPQTVQVDASEGPGPGGGGEFWAASADGSLAYLTADASRGLTADTVPGSGSNLYRYDVEAPEGHRLTDLTPAAGAGVQGVLGASEDGAYLYFVADGVLTGEEENGQGTDAVSGQPNLYLYHAGATTFVATLAASDAEAPHYNDGFPSDWAPSYTSDGSTLGHTARVSLGGSRLVFMSTRNLTGYGNVGSHCVPVDHEPAALTYAPGDCAEVYLYDPTINRLDCVSCNPSGERPIGPSSIPAGTRYEVGETTYQSRVLSADGRRVFFDSGDALVPGDSNGAQDVYEWEAPAVGGCTEQDPSYSASDGGCLYLISAGVGSSGSYFLDASADGSDVFFTTLTSLVPKDPGLVDLYDAREDGGEPPEAPPLGSCEGDACQSPPPAPDDPTPASSTYSGPGNEHPAPPKAAKCSKGKARKHGVCVSKKQHPKAHGKTNKRHRHHKRHANTDRGGAK